MEYVCKVGTTTGEVVEKTFSATDEASLRRDLEQQGYYLFALRRRLGGEVSLRRRRIAPQVLIIFGQELAALLKAGLPLFQSLDVMLERQRDPLFRASLAAIREKVKSGTALSEAIQAEGALYPPIFGASLVAGERSGSLETVLRRFVLYLKLSQMLKKKAIAAATYPAVLVVVMVVIIGILLIRVIPQFQDFYGSFNVELPLQTRLLMGLANTLRANLLWIVLALGGSVVGFVLWTRRERSAVTIDRFLLRIPYLGHLIRMYSTGQLARTLSTLLAGGLPLVNALEVAAASIGNRGMAEAVTRATPQIREGRSLTVALESTAMLDNLAIEMVKVGEQTGALAEMLNSVAEFYDEELDTRMATVMALVEPVMLIMMAVVVAAMLLAFYLPMFQIFSAIR